MTGFSTIKQDVVIAPNAPAAQWELKLLSLEQIKAEVQPQTGPETEPVVSAASAAAPAAAQVQSETTKPPDNKPPETNTSADELAQRAADGLLINGSVNNGAASPFAQFAAFGNNRNGAHGLFTGGIGVILDNSSLDARPFSLSGQNTPKPAYDRVTGVATLGGPLKIPHLFPHGPNFFVGYQWTRDRDDSTQSALVPDLAERRGDFSGAVNTPGQPVQIFDPTTGLRFPGNVIPQSEISSQARDLLNFYPLPNFAGTTRYNYQIPIVSNIHQDALQSRFDKTFNPRNQLYGGFAFLSTRTDTPNPFRLSEHDGCAGHQYRLQLVASFQPTSVPESWVPVQPVIDADHAIF
jgi:hypothetical protein